MNEKINESKSLFNNIKKRFETSEDKRLSRFGVCAETTLVHCENGLLHDAIKDILSPFEKVPSSSPFDIEAYITFCESPHNDVLPPESAELLEDVEFLRYYMNGEFRYIESPSAGWGMSDVRSKKLVVTARKKPSIDYWTIAHHLFNPLWMQLLKTQGIFALHAAGATKNGVTLLFPAYSGVGKSVLSLNLLENGFKLLGDDTVFLSETGGRIAAIGYPEKINLKKDAVKIFSNLQMTENRNNSSRKIKIDAEKLYPGCFIEKAVPSAIVLIERHDSAGSLAEPVGKTEALTKILKYSIFFVDPSVSKHHFHVLSKLTKQSDCFLLRIGTDKSSLLKAVDKMVDAVTINPEG